MYKAIYREYRPETFDEVIGQNHIVRILSNQVEAHEVSHAYLFCGTRGTGKTTSARLLAKAVNCLSHETRPCGECENCKAISEGSFMDVIEIDAASYNGIDQVRELRNSIAYPPTQGRKKVYIIDEAHMMTSSAFNGLLKTLEEPPEWAMLILATTDPQKLPQTVRSRCMRLEFKRVEEKEIINRIGYICKDRGIEIEERGLALLARNADGSVRDGLTLLEQCLPYSKDGIITRDMVLEAIGSVDDAAFIDIVDGILVHRPEKSLLMLEEALSKGKDPVEILNGLIGHYRNLMLIKYIRNPEDMLNMSEENIERIKPQAEKLSIEDISSGIHTLSETAFYAKTSGQPRILLELAIMKLSTSLIDMNLALDLPKSYSKPKPKPVNKEKNKAAEIKKDVTETEKLKKIGFSGNIDKLWLDVVDTVGTVVSHALAIKQSTRPIEITDEYLIVECMAPYCSMTLKRNCDLFNKALQKHSGMPITILERDNSSYHSSEFSGIGDDKLRNEESDTDSVTELEALIGREIKFEK